MKRPLFSLINASLLSAIIVVACAAPLTPHPQPGIETVVFPTVQAETVTLAVVPSETRMPASATPEFAPVCEADASTAPVPPQCRLPIAEESSTFCTNKAPYNLILIRTFAYTGIKAWIRGAVSSARR